MMGEELFRVRRGRSVARISAVSVAALLCVGLSACGGRVANPVPERTALDGELSCRHVIAEKRKLKKRIADLRDERNENRRRSLARIPGAAISGNPFSALFLADPSVAIYREINAATRRNRVLDDLLRQKGCISAADAAPASAPAPVTPAVAPATPAVAPAQPAVAPAQPSVAPVQPAAPAQPAPPAAN